MQVLIENKNKIIAFILFVLIIAIALSNLNLKSSEKLKIAYTEDLAGIIMSNIEEKAKLSKLSSDIEFLNIGDCCGSNAQFVLANNKVDIVVMCPDAVKYLNEIKNDYVEIGTILYDSDILISSKEKKDIKKIGYMNKRNMQKDALDEIFDGSVAKYPLFPSALPYALSNDKIDAAVVDVNSYLLLDIDGINITKNVPTQNIVVRKQILDDKRLEDFIKIYNEEINKINEDENYLLEMINQNLNIKNLKIEDLRNKWKKIKIRLEMLKK